MCASPMAISFEWSPLSTSSVLIKFARKWWWNFEPNERKFHFQTIAGKYSLIQRNFDLLMISHTGCDSGLMTFLVSSLNRKNTIESEGWTIRYTGVKRWAFVWFWHHCTFESDVNDELTVKTYLLTRRFQEQLEEVSFSFLKGIGLYQRQKASWLTEPWGDYKKHRKFRKHKCDRESPITVSLDIKQNEVG